MALTQLVYTLQPNVNDNKLRSDDPDGTQNPDGTQPPEPPDPGESLQSPYALGATSIGTNTALVSWSLNETRHTGQEIQQWIHGQSTSWESHPAVPNDVGKDVRSVTLQGLPPGTTVDFKVRCYRPL